LLELCRIEEFFAELEDFIKSNWATSKMTLVKDSIPSSFLEWLIKVVGAQEESTRGHFQHASIKVDTWGD
jgi:hypothetical protein